MRFGRSRWRSRPTARLGHFHVREKGMPATPCNPAAPGTAPRFRPPDNSLIRSESACSLPVPVAGYSLFRACAGPQPVRCIASNIMTLHGFPERALTAGQKNSLLAGKPDRRRRTGNFSFRVRQNRHSGVDATARGGDAGKFQTHLDAGERAAVGPCLANKARNVVAFRACRSL